MINFIDVNSLIAQASNIAHGENPSYTVDDFLVFYPQFAIFKSTNAPIVEAFIKLANANVKEARFHDNWTFMMALYIAHFLELYIKSLADGKAGNSQIEPLITSESAGDVSWSGDISTVTNDLNGWGAFKQTPYGIQYASLAKVYGLGGMYIY